MKRNVLTMTLLFVVSSFSMALFAQEHIDAFIKKCEAMESPLVDVDFTRTKSSQIGREMEMTMIRIHNVKELISEGIEAFEKDKSKAIEVTETIRNGKIMMQRLLFELKEDYSTVYQILISDNGDATVSKRVEKRNENSRKAEIVTGSFGKAVLTTKP